jgi:hypothetical protein
MLKNFNYVIEPTGADSPSQNGGVERFNQTLGTMTHCLLYGASLPATYWSYALVQEVYLLNRLLHSRTKHTPNKVWWGTQPYLSHLQAFGSQVCVKRTGHRCSKLDRHDFSGIFLGFTAMDQNVIYMDLVSGQIKSCHHAYFDEAWYLQPTRPPAAQLLYDCGLLAEEVAKDILPSPPTLMPHALYPPLPTYDEEFCTIPIVPAIQLSLPLSLGHTPSSIAAHTARLTPQLTSPHTGNKDSTAISDFFITAHDMSQVYISPHPYKDGLEIYLDLRHKKHYSHPAAGTKFITVNGLLILQHIDKGTLVARIPCWWSE